MLDALTCIRIHTDPAARLRRAAGFLSPHHHQSASKCESGSDRVPRILQQWPILKSFVFLGTILKEISAWYSETSGTRRSFSMSPLPARMNSCKPTKWSFLPAVPSFAPSSDSDNALQCECQYWNSYLLLFEIIMKVLIRKCCSHQMAKNYNITLLAVHEKLYCHPKCVTKM